MIAMSEKPELILSEIQREAREGGPGLRCPRCGCAHLVAETTIQQFDERKRWRVCRNCKQRVRTFERIG
jgi:transcription elongation factor Elf1